MLMLSFLFISLMLPLRWLFAADAAIIFMPLMPRQLRHAATPSR